MIIVTQSYQNACPNCKNMQYAELQCNQEAPVITRELDDFYQRTPGLSESERRRLDFLSETIVTRRPNENEHVQELRSHKSRDRSIRETLKNTKDHFRRVENNGRK